MIHRVRQNEAMVQGAYFSLHLAGTVFFGALSVLSALAVEYHWRRWLREVR